jgi:hypothetical protein
MQIADVGLAPSTDGILIGENAEALRTIKNCTQELPAVAT